MNPVQIVEDARPEVGPLPVIERNHLRERLFDVTVNAPATSGAHVQSQSPRRSNALRLGALALLGLVGVGGLAYSASRGTADDDVAVDEPTVTTPADTAIEPERNVVVEPPRPTIAPTTTAAPIAGTEATPLLLPADRTRLDELSVTRQQLGGSSLLLRAPDSTTVALREADGIAPSEPEPEPPTSDAAPSSDSVPETVPPRQFGNIEVALGDSPGSYDLRLPCGTLEVREGLGRLPYRPEITQLFESMSLSGGTIDIRLPAGWSVIGIGASTDEFLLGIPVTVAGRTVTVSLTQYPDGNLAVAGFGDAQYGPVTFLGQPAWISRDPDVPGRFELIGMLGTTAFKVGARDIALAELEQALATLTPGDVDDWISRFGPLSADVDPDIRTCQDQPEFNITGL